MDASSKIFLGFIASCAVVGAVSALIACITGPEGGGGPCSHPELPFERQYEVAVHEIGHLLVADGLGLIPLSAQTFPEGGQNDAGLCVDGLAAHVNGPPRSREQVVRSAAVSYGGYVAEEYLFGEATYGASDDIRRVTQHALSAVLDEGVGSARPPVAFAELGKRSILLSDWDASRPEGMPSAAGDVRSILDDAYQLALETLGTDLWRISWLADTLMREPDMRFEAEDLAILLGPPGALTCLPDESAPDAVP